MVKNCGVTKHKGGVCGCFLLCFVLFVFAILCFVFVLKGIRGVGTVCILRIGGLVIKCSSVQGFGSVASRNHQHSSVIFPAHPGKPD